MGTQFSARWFSPKFHMPRAPSHGRRPIVALSGRRNKPETTAIKASSYLFDQILRRTPQRSCLRSVHYSFRAALYNFLVLLVHLGQFITSLGTRETHHHTMPPRRIQALVDTAVRLLETTKGDNDDGQHDEEEGGHSEFGVHIEYDDLYNTVIFLTCIYLSGQIASRFLRMPSLVGEIVCGILLGPPLADFVPNPEAWVLLGELG